MKVIVQTTGQFSLIDFAQKAEINMGVPTVVRSTAFIEERLSMGQLKVLGQVGDNASQDEMAKYLSESDGDAELAVASFIAAFPVDAPSEASEEEKPVVKKGRR